MTLAEGWGMNDGREAPRVVEGVVSELAVASGVNRGAGIFVGISNLLRDVARGIDEGEAERSPIRLETGELVGV